MFGPAQHRQRGAGAGAGSWQPGEPRWRDTQWCPFTQLQSLRLPGGSGSSQTPLSPRGGLCCTHVHFRRLGWGLRAPNVTRVRVLLRKASLALLGLERQCAPGKRETPAWVWTGRLRGSPQGWQCQGRDAASGKTGPAFLLYASFLCTPFPVGFSPHQGERRRCLVTLLVPIVRF
jgi:hypothetical protein